MVRMSLTECLGAVRVLDPLTQSEMHKIGDAGQLQIDVDIAKLQGTHKNQ